MEIFSSWQKTEWRLRLFTNTRDQREGWETWSDVIYNSHLTVKMWWRGEERRQVRCDGEKVITTQLAPLSRLHLSGGLTNPGQKEKKEVDVEMRGKVR